MDSDKAPYIIVLCLSAFAWGIGYFHDKIVTAPVIEYHRADSVTKGDQSLRTLNLELTNITKEKLFKTITIWIRMDVQKPEDIVQEDIIGRQPYFDGSTTARVYTSSVSFIITKF